METRRVILFDGVCNLCNAAVRFIINRDPHGLFAFAPIQSPTGQRLTQRHQINTTDLDTLILIVDDKIYTRSSAALMIARYLQRPWPMMYGFILLPAIIRDAVYRMLARNRYRMFGRLDVCMNPTADVKDRFLSR